jgi:hypothetical protein
LNRYKVGDIFEIPLSDGRKAFGRFLIRSKMGPIIQIFSLITNEPCDIDEIVCSPELFPPVITGLFAAIKTGLWKVIGNIPPVDLHHPNFVSTNFTQDGRANVWHLWDGEKFTRIGKQLPRKYKSLEFLIGWDPQSVAARIESGKIPFPYGELIRDNHFTPRK